MSTGNRTRATIKALPSPHHPPSPTCWINPHSTTDDDVSKKPTCVRTLAVALKETIIADATVTSVTSDASDASVTNPKATAREGN